jgi:hypothetical protein
MLDEEVTFPAETAIARTKEEAAETRGSSPIRPSQIPNPHFHHSYLNATMGSTLVAPRAGM